MKTLEEALHAYVISPVDHVSYQDTVQLIEELVSSPEFFQIIEQGLERMEQHGIVMNAMQHRAARAVLASCFQAGIRVGSYMEKQEL